MITYVEGDLFTSPAQVLVNTVNTVGVMGKGVAKRFKEIYPEMYRQYVESCDRGELTVGRLQLYRTPHKWILNFPTKRHWRQPSRLTDVESGLDTFVATYAEHGIMSVAFPQLGCGNGGLRWAEQVRPLMERKLHALPIDVIVHVYAEDLSMPNVMTDAEVSEWLRAQPQLAAFDDTWKRLIDRVGCADNGWSEIGNREGGAINYQGGGDPIVIARDDVRRLWRELREHGFLSVDDLRADWGEAAEPLLGLFAQLPGVRPARFDRLDPIADDAKCARSVTSMVGVRFLSPVADPGDVLSPLVSVTERDLCPANPTTKPLQLSFGT